MKPRPCDSHNIWTDFPSANDWKCVRCGWHEKSVEVYMLEWMIDGKRPTPQLRLVDPGTTSPKPEE